MRKAVIVTLVSTLSFAAPALAVGPGNVIEFSKSPMGKVLFDGKKHQEAGAVCKDCHNNDMFPKMKQGTVQITMSEIYAGRLCGVCHNGKRAFGTQGNCGRCHLRP